MKAAKSTQRTEMVVVAEKPVVVFLNAAQLAAKLNVPTSWVREKSRRRARLRDKDPLPIVPLGKYVRFSWAQVEAWIERQKR
jgi:hypothetical protein